MFYLIYKKIRFIHFLNFAINQPQQTKTV